VRLGLVGGGLIAQLAHLPVLHALRDHFTVAALADPSQAVRTALGERYRIGRRHASHVELLRVGEIDAVLVSSPNATHAGVTLAALAAGVHVLVEKPLCLVPEDAYAIVSAARTAGRVVQVGYMKRHDAAWRGFCDELATAPPPRRIETTTIDHGLGRRFRPPDFVAGDDIPEEVAEDAALAEAEQVRRALGAADVAAHVRTYSDAFLGALIHDVNLVMALVSSRGATPPRPVGAAWEPGGALASASFVLSSRGRWEAAWLFAPTAAAFSESLRVYGDDGCRCLSVDAPYADVHGTYTAQLLHFHACVTAGAPCLTPAAQGAVDVALLAGAYRSAMAA